MLKSILLILFVSLLHLSALFGQQGSNVDDDFAKARKMGFSGKRVEARSLCYSILKRSPGYTEISVFIGRTYTWDHQYDSARAILKSVLNADPKNQDAINALVDIEYWSGDSKKAIEYCNLGLQINPTSPDFLLKKSKAVADTGNIREAYAIVNELLKDKPKDPLALQLAESLKMRLQINSVGFTYNLDDYNKTYDPWNQASLYYSRKTKAGSLIFRVNYANEFNTNAVQYEADMYPHISNNMYAYLNGGYSPTSIFSKYRFGASLYRNFPDAFEGDIGLRYLYFSSNTFIYTAAIGKYYSNFWFSLRTYLTPGPDQLSKSFSLTTRYYFNGADNYLSLAIGTGYSQTDITLGNYITYTPYLNSEYVTAGVKKRFPWALLLTSSVGYVYTEYLEDEYRGDFEFSIGLEKQF